MPSLPLSLSDLFDDRDGIPKQGSGLTMRCRYSTDVLWRCSFVVYQMKLYATSASQPTTSNANLDVRAAAHKNSAETRKKRLYFWLKKNCVETEMKLQTVGEFGRRKLQTGSGFETKERHYITDPTKTPRTLQIKTTSKKEKKEEHAIQSKFKHWMTRRSSDPFPDARERGVAGKRWKWIPWNSKWIPSTANVTGG